MGFFSRIGQAIGGAAKSTRNAVTGAAKSTREAVSSGTRKVLRRPPKEAAPAPVEQPPTPAPAPAEQPPAPAPAAEPSGPAPAEETAGGEGEEAPAEAEGGEGEEEEEEEEEGRPYYPGSVTITMEGDWQISGNRWEGEISGSFSGHLVKVVLDMLDTGESDALATVAAMILPQWDSTLGKIIDPWASDIYGWDES